MGEQTRRVVVVTGGSAGVGRATVRAFVERGADVAVIARGKDGLDGTAREIRAVGRRALAIQADVSDADAVTGAADAVEERLGPIDIWVNNAMTSVFSPVREMEPSEYRRVTDVTYHGVVHGTLAALKHMLPRDHGTIVQVGSALAYRGIPLQSAYCAAKHAIVGFTESLICELIHDGSAVRVTMVHMPALNTPQFGWVKSRLPQRAQPVPPIYQPEVAAEAIIRAVSRLNRRELMVGWPTLKTIWGNTVAPWYLDRYLAKHGFESQQTAEPEDPGRPDNLWDPVAGDHGAHGRFDSRSRSGSVELEVATHRGLATAAIGACVLGATAWIWNARRRK